MAELRPLTDADVPRLRALLQAHIETSMFPLTDLDAHGLGGTHPHGLTGWCRPDLSGALLLTNEGMAMPQLPGATDWTAAARLLAGRELIGCLGEAGQVRALLAACGLDAVPMAKGNDEPGYQLDLADLVIPGIAGTALAPLDAADRDLLIDWRALYQVAVFGAPMDVARDRAAADIDRFLRQGRHRLLLQDGVPVAMTGFNAVAGDTVQIGGVFTPPANRGRGFAGCAVALHLAEARAQGKRQAVLSAATPSAGRVYEALGFRRYGSFALLLFAGPERVPA